MNPEPVSELRTRPTLLFRLRDWQDAPSWEEFYRLYRHFVLGLAERAGLTHEEAEEVAQDVFKRVAETIAEFEANPQRGSFRRWLMNLTRWRIADKFRERPAGAQRGLRREGHDGTATAERIPDDAAPDAGWDDEWRKHVLDAALDRLARRINPRHFQAFDLYVRQNWPVLKVARELGLGPATVYLIGHRVKQQLKVEVAQLEARLG
ncbi:MAG: sigma-70 family RNA polymerase sigma factor [Opitutaceae bacterium]|nr:sigma-70 family RNA polymerase sigma factor [Opitutaceae bacterium]